VFLALCATPAWSQSAAANSPPECSVVLKTCAANQPSSAIPGKTSGDPLKAQLDLQRQRLASQAQNSASDGVVDRVVIEGQRLNAPGDPVKSAFEKYLPPPPAGPTRYMSPDGVVTDCVQLAWGRVCGSTTLPGTMPTPPIGSPILTR
jgi:hypothetical protein